MRNPRGYKLAPANTLPHTSSKASTLDLLSTDNSASENDADTVSLSLDSASGITATMSTESQYSNTQASDWASSRASSKTPPHPHRGSFPLVESPSEASLEQSSTWQSPSVEAGYFVLPDPLPSSAKVGTSPVVDGSSSATPTGSARRVFEDDIATQLCGSPRLKSVRVGKNAPPDAMGTATEGENNFLPLLEDITTYSGQSDIDKKLSKISKRLKNAQLASENNAAQPNAELQPSGIHPALRQTESQRASHDEQMVALDAEFGSIANEWKRLIRSAALNHRQLSEDVECLQRNQDRLLCGWEGMRNELLEMKVSQQQLRQHVNSTSGSNKQSIQSTRPSMASTGLRGVTFAPPEIYVKDDAGMHGSASNDPERLVIKPYLRDRNPPKSHSPTLIPDCPVHRGRQPAAKHTLKDTMSAPSAEVGFQRLPRPDHHAEHVCQYPQGCRWFDCPICRGGSFS